MKINKVVDRQFLGLITPPVKTLSYQPVLHLDVINSIEEQLDKKGFKISTETYKIGREGNQLIGTLGIQSYDSEMNFMMAFRNSYDKTMSLGYVAGTQVVICENGMLSGEIKLVRKHTGSVNQEINDKVISTINQLDDTLRNMIQVKEVLKQVEVSKRTQAELIGRMYLEENFITATQLGIIKEEMNFSEHFKTQDAFSLYQWCNHALKTSSPVSYINDHIKLHEFMFEEFIN